MSNININSLFRRFFDWIIIYSIILLSLSFTTNGTIMHVTCGNDVELTCPISATKKSDEVISWFRPNLTRSHVTFIAIGDILFPEYATLSRFNLISSPSLSRLVINNVLLEDQGIYTCKSSTSGQHSIKLYVNSHPEIFPSSPLFLYPVNHTFSITCSLSCNLEINSNDMNWYMNGELLDNDNQDFNIETISSNIQRLTVYLNKNFIQANYTCKYDGKEASILVRRRTKEELHRLPRLHNSSAEYLLQTVFDTGHRDHRLSYETIFLLLIFFILWFN